MEQISIKLCDALVRKNNVDKKYEPVYLYGITNFLMRKTGLATILLIGFITGVPGFMIFFYMAFSAVRGYYGGYHASTRKRCFIYSNLIFLDAVFFAKDIYYRIPGVVMINILILLCVVFCFLEVKKKKRFQFVSPATIILAMFVMTEYYQVQDVSKALFAAMVNGFALYIFDYYLIKKQKEGKL